MSYCKEEGKDKIIFLTPEDSSSPSSVVLPDDEETPGLILPNGDINWNCPCLGGMATGPCGVEFREAFSCFHYSKAEPKGSDCYEAFRTMQECMAQYPTVYGNSDETNDESSQKSSHQEEEETLHRREDEISQTSHEESSVKS